MLRGAFFLEEQACSLENICLNRDLSTWLLKVCDLTQFYSPVSGGVKRYLEQKVAFMRHHRPADAHILIIPGEASHCYTEKGATVYTIQSPLVSRTSRYRILLNLSQVERILEEEKPDIIESGDPYQVAWKTIVSGRALGIPTVGFYHSHFPEAYMRSVAKYFGRIALHITEEIAQRYVRTLYNRFARTLVPSPALALLLGDWGVENAVNIDLGVDTKVFHPNGENDSFFRKELQIPEKRTLLLYTGRLAAEKNVRTLFSAFELLLQAEPDKYHLLAIGDGSLRPVLQRLQESTNSVSWVSYCSDAQKLAEYYRAADVFVHPSVNETFGLVTLESQACGTPVVGIRGSYMDRIIFSDQTHWARENTPQALASAIQQFSKQNLTTAGLLAAKTVRDRYSWDAVFEHLFAIYQEVIEEYNP